MGGSNTDFHYMGNYRTLVDQMGSEEIGGKTVLYLVDAIYGGKNWSSTPSKWSLTPFNGDWPSSLLMSMDPVAIDSVAFDFLSQQWPDHVLQYEGVQDYLHEAALADDPPSGTFYDPEDDGIPMTSLGVHEHWNNPTDKQYSRNLGTGDGIELLYVTSAPTVTEFDLTINVSPPGGGSTEPAVGTHAYESGTVIEVTATPNPGVVFDHWNGDCEGSGACTVTMNSAKSVTAIFVESKILGDVNDDTVANSTDALIILSGDVGINISGFCPINCGDVNNDGIVNSVDALILLSADIGITVPFNVGQPGCPTSITQPPCCANP